MSILTLYIGMDPTKLLKKTPLCSCNYERVTRNKMDPNVTRCDFCDGRRKTKVYFQIVFTMFTRSKLCLHCPRLHSIVKWLLLCWKGCGICRMKDEKKVNIGLCH